MRSLRLFFKEVRFVQYRKNRLSCCLGKLTVVSKRGVPRCNGGKNFYPNAARARQILT